MTKMPEIGALAELPELLHPGSRTLFRHWERIRGERSAPGRDDVDLRTISSVLASVGILERHRRPTAFLWRVAGTRIGLIWGSDQTGHDLLAGWKGMERHSLGSCLDAVVDAHQPFVARFSVVAEIGEAAGAELLALPLKAQDGDRTQVLCAVLSFREPSWLATRIDRKLVLSRARVIWTEPVPGSAPEAPRGTRPVTYPLRLIAGGRE